jgi:hypothetical protein
MQKSPFIAAVRCQLPLYKSAESDFHPEPPAHEVEVLLSESFGQTALTNDTEQDNNSVSSHIAVPA